LPCRHLFIRPAASPRRNLFIRSAGASITAPQSFQQAGESHRRAAILSVSRQIPSPRRNLFSGPANLITAPQSFQLAWKSHRRAAIFSAGRRIPSPRNLFSGPANPIATQSFQ